jgi:glycerol transport system substrate-binding protein
MANKFSSRQDRVAMKRRRFLQLVATLGLTAALPVPRTHAQADSIRKAAARRWVIAEFTPSTLSFEQKMAEMEFFIRAAAPFRGQQIYVVSETIATHEYEARFLARAFREITDISVVHELVREGELIERLQTQMRTGRNFYDAYVNDSDLIGTHYRYDTATPLSDWIKGEAADFTLPTLDLNDFIGLSFTTAPNGKVYQLPDQQFANLYWFRYDWFQRPDLKEKFRNRYGYELGVPLNWKAYEDIADFFTNRIKELDGRRVYGHMDYGKNDPSLGWRFTDAWLSMAGVGDPGLPNGKPVDEWGIRVEDCQAVGSSVSRGGATNSPAAVYALRKYLEWLRQYAPPVARHMTFSDAGPAPGQGNIAQQIFWYTAFTADLLKQGLPVVNNDGTPKWRVAPSPHGIYWKQGMKLGYQDCGAWTLLNSTPVARRQAAWLYAQFTTCKTVSLKKTLAGLTPIRESDLNSPAMLAAAPRLGGLVEFYRSPARLAWTPTGTNVPDYPRLAQLWWTRIAQAVAERATPQQVMDNLADAQDELLGRLQQAGLMERCDPQLAEPRDPEYWLNQPGSPKPKLPDEEDQGRTIDYDQLIQAWRAGRVAT